MKLFKLGHAFGFSLLLVSTLALGGWSHSDRRGGEKAHEYRVRVALYSEKGLGIARKIERRLDKAGFNAYIGRAGKLSAVYVGRNLSERRAKAAKRRIDAMLEVNSLITSD